MSASRSERIRQLFDAAVGVSISQRAEMLDRECAGDGALRREVEELLAADDNIRETGASSNKIDGEFDESGLRWLAAVTVGDEVETETLPDRIGPFTIIRQIGCGGMGTVYEAQQELPLRRVALKVIRPGLVSRSLLRRFAQETRAMSQLRHPGIAQLLEAGATAVPGSPEARPYFAMELVHGETPLAFAKRETLSTEARLELVARVCDALHHAHQKGVIHRDLKPDNILVQRSGEVLGSFAGVLDPTVQPKILDFGVARFLEEPETGSLRTTFGQIVGTVPYISPEQAKGRSSEADIRSDIFAMGVIAYELVSERLPFDVRGMPVHAAIATMVGTAPKKLSAELPALRGDIETMIAKAMDADPLRRYQSAADFAADIRRFLRNEPIAARAPSAPYVLRKFVQRNRKLVFTASTAIVVLIASLVLLSVLWTRAKNAEQRAARLRYHSAMSATGFALSKGEIGLARQQMESVDSRFRGWEYAHFESRLDQSISKYSPAGAIAFRLVANEAESTDAFTLLDPSTSFLVRADSEFKSLHPMDQRLMLWYAARSARDTRLRDIHDATIYTPRTGTDVNAVKLTPWRFSDRAEFVNPKLSADGRTLVMLARESGPTSVVIVDLALGTVREIKLADGFVPVRLALSRDGQRIAVATGASQGREPMTHVFDASTGDLRCTIDAMPGEAYSLLLNGDGTRLTAAMHGGPMAVWDVAASTSRLLVHSPNDFDTVENLTLSDDEKTLAAAPNDGVIRIIDAASLALKFELIGHGTEINDLRFIRRDSELLSVGRNGEVRRWNVTRAPQTTSVLSGHTHLVHAIALGEKSNIVVTGSWDATVRLFDFMSGEQLAIMPADSFVQALTLSPEEQFVATREFGGAAFIYDVRNESRLTRLDRPMSRLDMPAFDVHSRVLTDIDPDARTATWWSVSTASWEVTPLAEASAARGAFVSASGAIAYNERRNDQMRALVLDTRTGRTLLDLEVRRPASESVAFSPDGTIAVAPGADHAINAYSLASGKLIGTYRGHAREVLALVFAPDGSRLFSADFTGTILVWDTSTYEEVTQLRGHDANVRRMIISTDGRTVISGSRDATARIWRVNER